MIGEIVGGVLGAGSGIAGSLIANEGARQRTAEMNEFNSAQAQKERDFNMQMYERQLSDSNTAVQRHTADLRAAGLNPMLAATKGGQSSTPTMAPAPQVRQGSPTAFGMDLSKIGKGIDTALNLKKVNTELENVKEQNKILKSQAAIEESKVLTSQLNQALEQKLIKDLSGSDYNAYKLSKIGLTADKAIVPGALGLFDRLFGNSNPNSAYDQNYKNYESDKLIKNFVMNPHREGLTRLKMRDEIKNKKNVDTPKMVD